MIIKCKHCGCEFDDGHPETVHGSHRAFCPECRVLREKEYSRKYYADHHAECVERKRRKRKTKIELARPAVSVRQKTAEADRRGMSYGKLVALEMQEAARRAEK